jgi:hypothetical protein
VQVGSSNKKKKAWVRHQIRTKQTLSVLSTFKALPCVHLMPNREIVLEIAVAGFRGDVWRFTSFAFLNSFSQYLDTIFIYSLYE